MQYRIPVVVCLLACLATSVLADTFINKQTGRIGKGKILFRETKDGRERILIEPVGRPPAWIWADEWEITKDDPKPAAPKAKAADAAKGPFAEVCVTGAGATPQEAEHNAFVKAVEMTVGVLVDAETVVENDELIKDKVLTHSKGFVEKFEVLRSYQADHLHYADIWARVAVTRLHGTLREPDVAVIPIDGRLAWNQIMMDVRNAENAAEMVSKVLAGHGLDTLFRVAIPEEPKTINNGAIQADLRFTVQFSMNEDQWKSLYQGLAPVLEKVALAKSSFAIKGGLLIDRHTGRTPHAGWKAHRLGPDGMWQTGARIAADEIRRVIEALKGDGNTLILLKDMNASHSETAWHAYRLPQAVSEAMDAIFRAKTGYHLIVDLVDGEGQPIATHKRPLYDPLVSELAFHRPHARTMLQGVDLVGGIGGLRFGFHYLVGPFLWGHGPVYFSNYAMELTVPVQVDQLRDMAKVAVAIKRPTKD